MTLDEGLDHVHKAVFHARKEISYPSHDPLAQSGQGAWYSGDEAGEPVGELPGPGQLQVFQFSHFTHSIQGINNAFIRLPPSFSDI